VLSTAEPWYHRMWMSGEILLKWHIAVHVLVPKNFRMPLYWAHDSAGNVTQWIVSTLYSRNSVSSTWKHGWAVGLKHTRFSSPRFVHRWSTVYSQLSHEYQKFPCRGLRQSTRNSRKQFPTSFLLKMCGVVSLVTRKFDHTSSLTVWQVVFTLDVCKMNCQPA
jgi:hypothetical protein